MGWRLTAVIVGAAAIGVLAVWLGMQEPPGRDPGPGSNRGAVATADAGSLDANGQLPGTAAAAPAATEAAPPAGRVIEAAREAAMPEIEVDPAGAGDAAEPPAPNDAGPRVPDASRRRHATTDAGVRRHAAAKPAPAGLVDTGAPPAEPPPAASPEPSLDALSRLFHNYEFSEIVQICRAATVRSEIASVCLMAACRARDVAQAKRWLPIDDPVKRDQLMTYCAQHGGIDLD